jgi:phosphomannomutase
VRESTVERTLFGSFHRTELRRLLAATHALREAFNSTDNVREQVAKMTASSNSSKIKFGTDGWRGIIADDFTFPNVRKVTRAIAIYLETAYTRDSPVLIAYNAHDLNSAGVLMFTSSHNPVRYCGIKYIPDYAGPATPEITDTIVANIESSSDEQPSTARRNSELVTMLRPAALFSCPKGCTEFVITCS